MPKHEEISFDGWLARAHLLEPPEQTSLRDDTVRSTFRQSALLSGSGMRRDRRGRGRVVVPLESVRQGVSDRSSLHSKEGYPHVISAQ